MQKHKHILLTLGLILLTIAGGIAVYTTSHSALVTTSATNFETLQKFSVATAAKEIERYFYDVQKRLETMALSPAVRDAQRSETCNQNLQDILEVNSNEFNNLGRIDKNGVFVCAVNRTIVGEPASKYGTYFAAIAKDPEHKPVMSRLIFPSGSASPVAAVHVPVYDAKGEFNGTIGGAVYFDELQTRIVSDKPTPNSNFVLYDDNLDILYDADPLVRSKNLLAEDVLNHYTPRHTITALAEDIKKGSAEGLLRYQRNANDIQVAYKSAKVIGRSWTLGVTIPYSEVRAAVDEQVTSNSLIGALMIAVTGLMIGTGIFTWRQFRRSNKPATHRRT